MDAGMGVHFEPSCAFVDHWWVFPLDDIAWDGPVNILLGGFDSTVHISEEASNPATAVPTAIILSVIVGGILGWGEICELIALRLY